MKSKDITTVDDFNDYCEDTLTYFCEDLMGDIIVRITQFHDGGCDNHNGVVTYEDFHYYSRSIKNEISRVLMGKVDNTTYEVIGNIYED